MAIDVTVHHSEIERTRDETNEPAIVARDLTKTYAGGVRALDGVCFEVQAGTVLALLGPNGAGKSTIVKILTTLSRPDAGRASVAGFDVLEDPERVRRAVGVVSQKSGADPEATGRENLGLQARIYSTRGDVGRRIDSLLRRFGLAAAADRLVRTYSGGMQRRLDIAMGIVHGPTVLFLDEPTTGLDPEIRADMWSEIGRLTDEEGLTILLTTHYLEEADRLASQLAILDRGRVVAEGSPEQLKGELHGDAIDVELARAEWGGRAISALTPIAGVRDVTLDGSTLRARADDAAAAVPAVLAALELTGAGVTAVRVARPSLDDVYLRYAGRRFDESDTGHRKEDR
jgi:ABC-2 type transport system ATP-binding protein